MSIGSGDGVPQWLGWLSKDRVLVLYQNRAVLYDANGGERGSYDFGGSSLVSVSAAKEGAALLLENGQLCTAVLLDKDLGVQLACNVLAAHRIVRDSSGFYLLTDSTVERFDTAGQFQWNRQLEAQPQALFTGRQLLVVSGNTVQQLTPPEQDAGSAGQ